MAKMLLQACVTSQALRHYTTVLRIRPNSADLINNLGYSLYLHRDFNQAEIRFRQAIAADPALSKARYNLALIYVRDGRYQDAVALLTDKTGGSASANNLSG